MPSTVNFPTTSLTPNVTTYTLGTRTWLWNGAGWEIVTQTITGYTGSIGYTGSSGVGYTGSKGDIGYSGSLGYTGSKGDIGYSGSLGYTGSQGVVGFTGSTGIGYTGSKGDQGTQGNLGYTGSKGDLGYSGSSGSTFTLYWDLGNQNITSQVAIIESGDQTRYITNIFDS